MASSGMTGVSPNTSTSTMRKIGRRARRLDTGPSYVAKGARSIARAAWFPSLHADGHCRILSSAHQPGGGFMKRLLAVAVLLVPAIAASKKAPSLPVMQFEISNGADAKQAALATDAASES